MSPSAARTPPAHFSRAIGKDPKRRVVRVAGSITRTSHVASITHNQPLTNLSTSHKKFN